MTEPTYEELKARLAELEKQGTRRTGSLEFRVSERKKPSIMSNGSSMKKHLGNLHQS